MSKKTSKKSKKTSERLATLRSQILAVDLLCPGSIVKRFNTCGKPHCRCAQDSAARHGPYYIWSRRENGRLVQSVVSPSQAKALRRAIKNLRKVLRILDEWGRKSAQVILGQ